MYRQNWKVLTLTGVAVLCLVGDASACFWRCKSACGNAGPCAPAACAPAPCAPAPCVPRKVMVCEMVPEVRQCVRTTYKMQERVEKCVAYRCVPTMEERCRTICIPRYVTETVMQTRTCVERIPCWETRTITKTRYVKQQVCETRTRCVDRGHWEYKEVPVCGGGLFKKDCCDACPKTKCVKCWVPCKVTETYQVNVCKKVPICETCQVRVCVYKKVCKTVQVPVCRTRCIKETRVEKYQVCVNKKVPYETTRTVCVCVPCPETYTVTVCVPKWTEKIIPCP